jgi:succinyl-diaminopimelate desuccinylase
VERDRPLVLLVGHLDVVPRPTTTATPGSRPATATEVVVARGASDMKAGNVVAMPPSRTADLRAASPYDLVLVLYAGEEGAADATSCATCSPR